MFNITACYSLFQDGTTIRRSVFDPVDPSKPPGGYAVVLPLGVVAFLLILLWRGWIGAATGSNLTYVIIRFIVAEFHIH